MIPAVIMEAVIIPKELEVISEVLILQSMVKEMYTQYLGWSLLEIGIEYISK